MFQIRWFDRAIYEQKRILEYWIERNQSNAYSRSIYNEVKKVEKRLSSNPFLCSATKYDNIRRCVILNYFSLYYKVDDTEKICYIIYFWDNRQDPDKLKKHLV